MFFLIKKGLKHAKYCRFSAVRQKYHQHVDEIIGLEKNALPFAR